MSNYLRVASKLGIGSFARNIHKRLQPFRKRPLHSVLNRRLCTHKLDGKHISDIPTLAVLHNPVALVTTTCEFCVEHICHVTSLSSRGRNLSQVGFAAIRQFIHQNVPVLESQAAQTVNGQVRNFSFCSSKRTRSIRRLEHAWRAENLVSFVQAFIVHLMESNALGEQLDGAIPEIAAAWITLLVLLHSQIKPAILVCVKPKVPCVGSNDLLVSSKTNPLWS